MSQMIKTSTTSWFSTDDGDDDCLTNVTEVHPQLALPTTSSPGNESQSPTGTGCGLDTPTTPGSGTPNRTTARRPPPKKGSDRKTPLLAKPSIQRDKTSVRTGTKSMLANNTDSSLSSGDGQQRVEPKVFPSPSAAGAAPSRAPTLSSSSDGGLVVHGNSLTDREQQVLAEALGQREISSHLGSQDESRSSSVSGKPSSPITRRQGRYHVLLDQPLGTGGFGTVYKGFDEVTGKHVAIKRANFGHELTAALRDEYELLTKLDHPNIVRVLHIELSPTPGAYSEIAMECMSCGSVSSLIEETNYRLHEGVIRRYAQDALRGLAYLHECNVLHRDLKPGNFLISGDGVLKLSDFGTSKQAAGTTATGSSIPRDSSTRTVVGTSAFLAPETITQGKYSRGSDMWAFGCALVEMAQGQPPWSELPAEKRGVIPLMFHIGTAQPPDHHPAIPPHISPALRAIIQRCFAHKPKRRASAKELLDVPYFSSDELPPEAELLEEYYDRKAEFLQSSGPRQRSSVYCSFTQIGSSTNTTSSLTSNPASSDDDDD